MPATSGTACGPELRWSRRPRGFSGTPALASAGDHAFLHLRAWHPQLSVPSGEILNVRARWATNKGQDPYIKTS